MRPRLVPQEPQPAIEPLVRYKVARSWIAQGSPALVIATDGGLLIRLELDEQLAAILLGRLPEWMR